MNLSKKTSIWDYILENNTLKAVGGLILVCFLAFLLWLTGHIISYFITPSSFLHFVWWDSEKSIKSDILTGTLFWIAIFIAFALLYFIIQVPIVILTMCRTVQIYHCATCLPISEEECIRLNIHNAEELTAYLKQNVFNNIHFRNLPECIYEESSDLWPMQSDLIWSYIAAIHVSNKYSDLDHKSREKAEKSLALSKAGELCGWLIWNE